MKTGKWAAPCLILACCVAAAQPSHAQDVQISLSAARAKTGEENEVRLLWTVTQGWVPTAGVDVYRSDKPTQKLNASPIKFDPQGLTPEAAARVNRAITPGRKLFGAGIHVGTSGTPLSSLGAFQAFKGRVATLQGTAGVRPGQLASEAAKAPEVLAYRKNLLTVPAPAAKVAQVVPSADDATASTRIQVLIASLANYTAALHYGFAYTDKSALPGVAYTYTLKAADTGATLNTASVRAISLRAEGDSALNATQPPAPVPDAVQLGQGRVALHWEPVAPTVEQALVSLNYNVYRGGKQLNKSPIHLAYLPTTDNGHVATMASFIDDDAPQSGTAAYTVTLMDAFGRVSSPGAASALMVDLRVPGPTSGMIAVLSKRTSGAIRLFWVACDPAAGDMPVTVPPAPIDYCIYRTASGQAETQISFSVADTQPASPSTTGLPAGEFDDLTVGTFLGLDPTFRDKLLAEGLTEKERLMRRNNLKKILNAPVSTLLGQIPFGLKPTFTADLGKFRTYLDAAPAQDTDYVYRVAPRYILNDQHYGTGARTATLAVPTTAAPGAVAQFGSAFTKGAGTFGYVEEGATPTMRLTSSSGAVFEQGHFKAPTVGASPTLGAATGAAPSGVSAGAGAKTLTGARGTAGQRKTGASFAGLTPIAHVNTFLLAHPQYKIADNEKAPPMAIAGTVKLTWQASAFTSPPRYRIYRAAATGLFPIVQTASRAGAPITIPTLNTVAKIGGAQKTNFAAVAKARATISMKYFADNPNVPNQNYALLAETAKLQFTDTIPASQRMHYLYRVVPVSRWNVEGPQTPVADVTIPAALPPSIPTLLKTQVDDGVADGHVRLTVGTNPANENVAKYYVFRKLFTDSTGQAMREVSSVRVASRRGAFAVPPPTLTLNPGVPPSHLQNIGTLKANNSALLKSILDPTTYKLAGTIAAPTNASAGAPLLQFVDTAGVPRVPYTYMIVAVNSDQISSKPSAPLDATALKVYCASPTGLKSVVDTTGDSAKITLSWQSPTTETPTNYILERTTSHLVSAPTSKLGQIQQLKDSVTTEQSTYVTLTNTTSLTFPDNSVRSGRRYTYRLRAVDSEGLVSKLLTTTADVPALAAANFGDPAPPTVQPVDPTKAPTLNTPTTPVNPTSRPTAPVATTGTPKLGTPGAGGGTLGTPKAATGTARFRDAYFLTGSDVFAVQIEKASYSVQGYLIDAQNFYYCRPTEKFLKLTLLVKNVTGQPQPFDYQTITAGGLTADGDDLAQTKNWKALDTNQLANRTVAPGASFEIEGVVTVPADGSPKNLAFGGLTFDLTDAANAVEPLPAALGGGIAAPVEAPAKMDGTFYSLAFTDGAVKLTTLPGGIGVSLTVRNATGKALSVANENYTVELYDEDGDKYPVNKSTAAPVSLAPGATTTLHFAFDVPKTIKLQSLKVRERDGRIYVFPIGAN